MRSPALPLAWGILLCSGVPAWSATHPLDPLSREELSTAVRVLRDSGKVGPSTRFPILTLREPPKPEVLQFKPGAAFRRQAFCVVYDRAANKTYEALVDLSARSVAVWKEMRGVQPPLSAEDYSIADRVVREDPRWQEAIRKRGIPNLAGVQLDVWPAGYFGLPGEDGVRMTRAVAYYRGSGRNHYARPIEGVVAYVDLTARRVTRLVDTGVVPVPQASAEYGTGTTRQRPPLKPLRTVQLQGPDFQVQGNEVRWQNWRFRYSMTPREGLVLHLVGYEDGGRVRPVLYRGSLSEMAVPYGDPSPSWFFRGVFDAGEGGLGSLAMPLEAGTDTPDNAVLLDTPVADEYGEAELRRRNVALYERDGGLLWKHFELGTGRNESRRARQLVLGYVSTVGNYDYGFNWIFHQDGTLEMEVQLTGIMTTKAVGRSGEHAGGAPGHLVMPRVEAVQHQHFFSFRLDVDVDGVDNSVVETSAVPVPPGPENPYGNAFTMREVPLRTEREAIRLLDLPSGRRWRVINPGVPNALGQPAGFTLVPGENALPLSAPDSWFRRRAGFLNAHLWVTPFEPGELFAAGDYPNQSRGGEGLPAWTAANRSIANGDVVLWYTMGITHLPRPEDWPVMPVHRAGFKLLPTGFFSWNPALDVPRPEGRP